MKTGLSLQDPRDDIFRSGSHRDLSRSGERYTQDLPAVQSDYIKPQLPMMYDLSSDPHEDSNLWYTDLTQGWMLAPALMLIGAFEKSLKEYPNIKVGEEFEGYKK
jgi:arylsulfatase